MVFVTCCLQSVGAQLCFALQFAFVVWIRMVHMHLAGAFKLTVSSQFLGFARVDNTSESGESRIEVGCSFVRTIDIRDSLNTTKITMAT